LRPVRSATAFTWGMADNARHVKGNLDVLGWSLSGRLESD